MAKYDSPRVVAAKRTPMSPQTAAEALRDGYRAVAGQWPTRDVLRFLMAQWAFETGNGQKMFHHNFGNKKWTGQTPEMQYLRCSERVRQPDGTSKLVQYPIPHPSCRFAVYDSPTAGARAHVELLRRRPHWWAGLHSGSLDGFNRALSTSPKYYTADPAVYGRGMQSRGLAY